MNTLTSPHSVFTYWKLDFPSQSVSSQCITLLLLRIFSEIKLPSIFIFRSKIISAPTAVNSILQNAYYVII